MAIAHYSKSTVTMWDMVYWTQGFHILAGATATSEYIECAPLKRVYFKLAKQVLLHTSDQTDINIIWLSPTDEIISDPELIYTFGTAPPDYEDVGGFEIKVPNFYLQLANRSVAGETSIEMYGYCTP